VNWEDLVAVIAATFHFPAREIMCFTIDDLIFWLARAEWYTGQTRGI
jgi:hypothetical protein